MSNHGGRQLDGALSAIRVLPDILDAVGDRLEVYFDSGIRSGQDILKALARLGAMGEPGVTRALEILRSALDTTMALCGHRDINQVDREILLVPEDFTGRSAG